MTRPDASCRRPPAAAARAAALAALPALLLACRNPVDPAAIVATGHVEATQVRLATKIGGALAWFPLDEGVRVDAGQEVARIDPVDLELALAAARAERELTDAQWRQMRAGFRREEVAAARAETDRARAELAAAERELARFQGLWDAGSGTGKARDDAATRRDLARETLRAAEERLGLFEAGYRREEVDAAAARLAAAEARIAAIEQQVRDATVRSPVAGVVTESLVERGELLPQGATLAVVTDLAAPWITAYLAETDLGRVRLGQEAEVTTDDGQSRRGRLTWVSPRAEFTPKNVQTRDERVKLVFKVKISLDNEDGLFKPGMPATVRLAAASPAAAAARDRTGTASR